MTGDFGYTVTYAPGKELYASVCNNTELIFAGCAHVKEKGCVEREAVKKGLIPAIRHESYVRLYEQAGEQRGTK